MSLSTISAIRARYIGKSSGNGIERLRIYKVFLTLGAGRIELRVDGLYINLAYETLNDLIADWQLLNLQQGDEEGQNVSN